MPARLSRKQMMVKILPLFKDHGYEAVSINMIARALNLAKPSLYYHFAGGKEAIARYALASAGADMQSLIIGPLMDRKLTPSEAISRSLQGVLLYYSGDAPQCLMNSMTMGAGHSLFAADVEKAIAGWIAALGRQLQAGGLTEVQATAAATETVEKIQGSLILNRLKGGRTTLEHCITQQEKALLRMISG